MGKAAVRRDIKEIPDRGAPEITVKRPTSAGPAVPNVILVKIEDGRTGLMFATSPNMAGLRVAEPDLPTLMREIPLVIEALYAAQGKAVRVLDLPHSSEFPKHTGLWAWVVVPAAAARRAAAPARARVGAAR